MSIVAARDGGLSLAGARMMWASTHLARAMAVLPYLLEHCAVYQLTDTALQPDAALPYFDGLRVALRALHDQSLTACVAYPDLASLLSGPPRSQHDLAEGVFASRLTAVREAQPDDRHRARVLSAGGQHAGAWLAVFPMTMWATARARHFQLALAMRLGCALPELLPVRGAHPICGAAACGALHDEFGFHPGVCRAGNRWGLWTTRHDAFQAMLVHVLRILGCTAASCSVGAGNWFGAAGVRPGSRGYRRADVVMAHYYGPGRHLFLDCAITDPCSGGALSAVPSSATSSGVAAEQRAEKKVAKYGPLAASVSSMFRPAVVERFGACCDGLVGLVSMLCGERQRDGLRDGDYAFSASSRSTYTASLLVFAAVMADAAMIERVVGVDASDAAPARYGGAPARHAWVADVPGQREIEGMGGRFWYEAQ